MFFCCITTLSTSHDIFFFSFFRFSFRLFRCLSSFSSTISSCYCRQCRRSLSRLFRFFFVPRFPFRLRPSLYRYRYCLLPGKFISKYSRDMSSIETTRPAGIRAKRGPVIRSFHIQCPLVEHDLKLQRSSCYSHHVTGLGKQSRRAICPTIKREPSGGPFSDSRGTFVSVNPCTAEESLGRSRFHAISSISGGLPVIMSTVRKAQLCRGHEPV